MTRKEQMHEERAQIARLEKILAKRRREMQKAERAADSIEGRIELAYARLGVNSTEKLLAAHKASLETIKRRKGV